MPTFIITLHKYDIKIEKHSWTKIQKENENNYFNNNRFLYVEGVPKVWLMVKPMTSKLVLDGLKPDPEKTTNMPRKSQAKSILVYEYLLNLCPFVFITILLDDICKINQW